MLSAGALCALTTTTLHKLDMNCACPVVPASIKSIGRFVELKDGSNCCSLFGLTQRAKRAAVISSGAPRGRILHRPFSSSWRRLLVSRSHLAELLPDGSKP